MSSIWLYLSSFRFFSIIFLLFIPFHIKTTLNWAKTSGLKCEYFSLKNLSYLIHETCFEYDQYLIRKLNLRVTCYHWKYLTTRQFLKIICSPKFYSIFYNILRKTIKSKTFIFSKSPYLSKKPTKSSLNI